MLDTPSNDLVTLPPGDALTVFTTEGAMDPLLQRIRAEIDAFVPDLSTAGSRKAIASMAYRVSRAKTYLDDAGKDLVAKQKEIPNKIDACRRKLREKLDAWRDEVRKPLDEWEAAEDARVNKHKAALADLMAPVQEADASVLRGRLAKVEAIEIGPACEEFEAEYALAKDAAVVALRTAVASREKYEADQDELRRLRAESEARARADREEAERRAAEERARKAAEESAAAEQARIEAAVRAEREAAERREAALRLAAEEERRKAAETENRLRHEAEEKAAREAAEAEAREANRRHRGAVHRAALAALVAGGVPEECAKSCIELIASKRVPAIAITY